MVANTGLSKRNDCVTFVEQIVIMYWQFTIPNGQFGYVTIVTIQVCVENNRTVPHARPWPVQLRVSTLTNLNRQKAKR